MVRVPAHAHRDELDEGRAPPRARALDGPRERRRDLVGVGAVDRDAGNAVARGLVGEDADRGLLAHGRRERGLVVLDREHRRQPARGAQVDGLVPLAERGAALADEGQGHAAAAVAGKGERHPGHGQRADGQRRGGGQNAPREIADVQVLAVHRRSGLPHLRGEDLTHGLGRRTHRERHTEIANHRRDDVARPGAVLVVRLATTEPNARRVDGFLTERSEPLALKRRVAVADFPAGEERLQPRVGRAGEDHAAQDFAALVGRERGADRGPVEKAVARLHELISSQLKTGGRFDAGRRLQPFGRGDVLQPSPERGVEGRAQRVERRLVGADRALARVERGAHRCDREGVSFDDERFQAPRKFGRRMNRRGPGHAEMLTPSGLRAQGSRLRQNLRVRGRRLCLSPEP